jgi:hypothetical protein
MPNAVRKNLGKLEKGRLKVQQEGLRTYRVWVRQASWSTGEIHLGTRSESLLEITPAPKVSESTSGELTVTNITPAYPGGGYTTEQLIPPITQGVDFDYVVRGPDGVDKTYQMVGGVATNAFRYTLRLQRCGASLVQPDLG